ncbi:MAG: alpha/beta hydrolase [Planctomycetota bacterium]
MLFANRLARLTTALTFFGSVTLASLLQGSEPIPVGEKVVKVWPEAPPTWNAPSEPEADTTGKDGRSVGGQRVVRLGNVSSPELHVFSPSEDAATDTAVVICPGGGFSILAWDLEGTEIATWLRGMGVTAIVLKYRVPTRSENSRWKAPVQDIQRSIAMVRTGTATGKPIRRVGVLGFSAGGHASVRAATAKERYYEPIDKTDEADFVPDFAVLVYPAWLTEENGSTEVLEDITIDGETPPMFFAHAIDDRISCLGSVAVFTELVRQKSPSALHVFSAGGHGFGARESDSEEDSWTELCGDWLRQRGWLGTRAGE